MMDNDYNPVVDTCVTEVDDEQTIDDEENLSEDSENSKEIEKLKQVDFDYLFFLHIIRDYF